MPTRGRGRRKTRGRGGRRPTQGRGGRRKTRGRGRGRGRAKSRKKSTAKRGRGGRRKTRGRVRGRGRGRARGRRPTRGRGRQSRISRPSNRGGGMRQAAIARSMAHKLANRARRRTRGRGRARGRGKNALQRAGAAVIAANKLKNGPRRTAKSVSFRNDEYDEYYEYDDDPYQEERKQRVNYDDDEPLYADSRPRVKKANIRIQTEAIVNETNIQTGPNDVVLLNQNQNENDEPTWMDVEWRNERYSSSSYYNSYDESSSGYEEWEDWYSDDEIQRRYRQTRSRRRTQRRREKSRGLTFDYMNDLYSKIDSSTAAISRMSLHYKPKSDNKYYDYYSDNGISDYDDFYDYKPRKSRRHQRRRRSSW